MEKYLEMKNISTEGSNFNLKSMWEVKVINGNGGYKMQIGGVVPPNAG